MLVMYIKFMTTEMIRVRSWYRETRFECGDYMEVNLYPVYTKAPSRRKKAKPTSETQQKLNELNAEHKLIRIANANFGSHDLKIELTYSAEHLPEDDEAAARELRNFLRRVKRYRQSRGLSELKYIAVTEKGPRSGRYHHHLIMNGDIELFDLVQLWGNGIVGTDMLQFDQDGIASLARYMMKQAREFIGKKKYTRSRNLIDPPPKSRDNRFSKRKIMELAKDTDNRAEFEKLYEGYRLSRASVVYNEANGGVYIYARYYKQEAEWCRRQAKKTSRPSSSGGLSSRPRNMKNSN